MKIGRPKISITPAHVKFKNGVKGAPAPKNRIADPEIWQKTIDANPLIVVSFYQQGCAGCPVYSRKVMSKAEKKWKTIPQISIELVHDKSDPAEKLADKMRIETTPASIVFAKGVEVGRVDSYGEYGRDAEALDKILERYA